MDVDSSHRITRPNSYCLLNYRLLEVIHQSSVRPKGTFAVIPHPKKKKSAQRITKHKLPNDNTVFIWQLAMPSLEHVILPITGQHQQGGSRSASSRS
jgi:hypothetical protein